MPSTDVKISDITRVLEDFAPLGLAESWDSVGLHIGNPDHPCRSVAIALDVTLTTLEAAIAAEAELLITHHPLLFRPVKEIRFDRPQGHMIQRLCRENISLYSMHTNLDSTVGGLNDYLADQIGLEEVRTLLPPPETTPKSLQNAIVGLGRVGRLKKPGTLHQLAKRLKQVYDPEAFRMIGHDHLEVTRVALCTGSGGSLVHEAISAGADCLVTGDVKYHQALDAEAAGMSILDIGHFATEIIAISILESVLKKAFPKGLRIIPIEEAFDPIRPYRD